VEKKSKDHPAPTSVRPSTMYYGLANGVCIINNFMKNNYIIITLIIIILINNNNNIIL
jgi:hypothetical protein